MRRAAYQLTAIAFWVVGSIGVAAVIGGFVVHVMNGGGW